MKKDFAAITKEGTVMDVNGKDVTATVKTGVLTRAVAAGDQVMYLDDKGWHRYTKGDAKSIAKDILKAIATPTPVVEVSDEQTNVLGLIHNSYDKKPDGLVLSELKWKYMVRSVVRAKNIMMTGPAGCGKTFTAQSVAKGMERPFFYFNLGATQDPRATLIGNTHFKEGQGTFFNSSLFVKAIQTEGAVILLDELSRAHPEAWNILMPVLDEGQRYLRLDEQENAPTIQVADGVSFIATANIGNEFTSTRVMDRALMDRFTIVEVDTLDKDSEAGLLSKAFPAVSGALIDAIASIADSTRMELNTDNPRISSAISTRSTLDMAGLINDGFTLSESAEVAIFPFFDNAGGMDSERTFVRQLVQKFVGIEDVATTSGDDDDLFNITDV